MIGPLFGAVVLAVADWQAIFLINLAVGLVLAAAIRATGDPASRAAAAVDAEARPPDWIGAAPARSSPWSSARSSSSSPPSLVARPHLGRVLHPVRRRRPLADAGRRGRDGARWCCSWSAAPPRERPLVDLRGWGRSAREADLVGALLLAVALGGVILAFATADPEVQVFSDQGLWYLLGSAVATVAFVLHLRRADGAAASRAARCAVRRPGARSLVSFFVGAALIAALIDIPIFARTTIYPSSQLMAALVLVRFLVALPVGAVVGGYLIRTLQRRRGHRGRHGAVGGRLRC